MPFLPNGYAPNTLEDVLSQSAGAQTANLTDQYNQARRRMVAEQGASGRLMSGVASYPLTDLDTNYQQGLSGIQTNLAEQEAGIPAEDWLNTNQFNRQRQLMEQIASNLKPSTLDEIFQGIGAAGNIGATAAGFALL